MLVPLLSRSACRQPATCLSCCPMHTASASSPSHMGAKSSLSALRTKHNQYHQHHRRHSSSSKPPSPPNNDSAIPASTGGPSSAAKGGAATATASAATTRKRSTSSKSGKQLKAKDGNARATAAGLASASSSSSLPSVPSTQHLHSQDINLASFFSLHRPISVVSPLPPTSSSEAFSAIFKPVAKSGRVSETIYTLASAVKGLERMMHPSGGQQDGRDELRAAITQSSASNAEPDNVISINMEELAKNFRPFNPPPPPVPMPDSLFQEGEQQQQRQHQKASTNTQETPLSTTNTSITKRVHHRAVIVPFFKRMQPRRVKWTERRVGIHNEIRRAISVRRQRKLKMKKHKYKKLMKRTRNLRRRQDRL